MPKTRRITTNFSKGELSPLIEGMPDIAAYFEGGSVMANWLVLRQGGMTRWPGTRFIKEVKDSSKDTILLPFEFSVDESYPIEMGNQYFRVYKDKAPVLNAGVHVEVATPYLEADLRSLHYTQSADVLFLFHVGYQQRKLSRVSDTSWSIPLQTAVPPPSFEADTDLVATLGIGANTGTGIKMRAGSAVFLAGDIGRQVISGAGRAVITAVDNTSMVTVDILDAFSATITAGPNQVTTTVGTTFNSVAHGLVANDYLVITSGAQSGQVRRVASVTNANVVEMDAALPADIAVAANWNKVLAIASGGWFVRLSPQTTLDPNIKSPIGAQVTLVTALTAFRSADVGKFIKVYGGVVKITAFDSTTQVRGEILSELADSSLADPAAAAAGAWTLEVASWSALRGWPRTGEFFQGRLYQASTLAQPTTFWGSRSDDFDNNAVGVAADDAVEYTLASRQVNRIEWLAEKSKMLMLGTSGSEHSAVGSGNDNALIGGDTIPSPEKLATNGCMAIQPIQASKQTLIYLDRSRRRLMAMGFDLMANNDSDRELSVGSEHITGSGARLGPLAYAKRLNPRIYFVREDGTLVTMTYFPEQKITAFSLRVTDGTFESVCVIPQATGGPDQVWVIVKRTINGLQKRYVEFFEEEHEALQDRQWTSMQTDCGIVVTGLTGTTISGLSHLEGKTVDIIKNGSALAQATVSAGAVTVQDELVAEDVLEIGLHYDSSFVSMRPAVEGQVIEGLPRSWDSLFVRLHNSRGGKVNGQPLEYPPTALDLQELFTGDVKVTPEGVDTDGRIDIVQDQPYPMTVLCAFGTLNIGEKD